jgi:sulfite oxidase
MLRLICLLFALSSVSLLAAPDGLLIQRSSRPFMAEASIDALHYWETPLEGFFVRTHHNTMPAVIDDSWSVSFEGLLAKPRQMTVHKLKSMPQRSFHAILECSGNGRGLFTPGVSGLQWKRGAVGNGEWTGVALKDVFDTLSIMPSAKYMVVEGYDDPVVPSNAKFVRSIPLSMALETNAILALRMNREPIPVAHGGPVRLVLPNIYGQNWIKWVTKITFSEQPDSRSYSAKAYRMPTKTVKPGEAWDAVKDGRPIERIKVQTILTAPRQDEKVTPGVFLVEGKAFSGNGAIKSVEISMDGGQSWAAAKVTPRKDYSWQAFEFSMNVEDGVKYEILARAVDEAGNSQPLQQEWNPKGYLYNAADRVSFEGDSLGVILADGLRSVRTHCLTCHSSEIIEQQNLDKAAWAATVKKMADYGLVLDERESDKIATALAARPKDKNIFGQSSPMVDLSHMPSQVVPPAAPRGRSAQGAALFAEHCAACHGQNGEGQTGPRLKGRAISNAVFWTSVNHGKRKMPAFAGSLRAQDLADIKEWLAR